MQVTAYIEPKRIIGKRDPKIYGHFLEHFHRQIYGGIYDPGSALSNEEGFRSDVVQALRDIQTPIIRWPGGCFVSAYHWKDGIGKDRLPSYDKAWWVEEPNTFGTDEFISFCRQVGAEPYICTNAGTGTPEEMSEWVEYCNLNKEGRWAKARIENGHNEPFRVKYWSIGNENYGTWEMGAKSADEWGRFVLESAKMMKRVDPSIEILAASTPDVEWNLRLLKEAGPFLDWISIHGYWNKVRYANHLSDYETCMLYSLSIEEPILQTKNILGALGYLGKIRIAFDEWNLRGWYHPHMFHFDNVPAEDCAKARDENDINSSYTMADAVFSACFLNQCLKHSDVVGMANFSPVVNTRGAIYTYDNGLLLRPSYFVFQLYAGFMGDEVVDCWISENDAFEVKNEGETVHIPSIDIIPTVSNSGKELRVAIVNRNPDKTVPLKLKTGSFQGYQTAKVYSIIGKTKDSYNDLDKPDEVKIVENLFNPGRGDDIELEINPHSVNVLVLM
jgi:alpha-N-arabinofuranosidase